MSAEVINEIAELPVYTVHGINWHIDVPMDLFNSQQDKVHQAYEAASIAMYIFKGEEGNKKTPIRDEERGIFIVMDSKEDVPLLGSTMIVHLRGTDPAKGYVPFTFEILANCGFYQDSKNMAAVLESELAELKEIEVDNEHARAQILEQAKRLQKSLTIKKKGLDKPESSL